MTSHVQVATEAIANILNALPADEQTQVIESIAAAAKQPSRPTIFQSIRAAVGGPKDQRVAMLERVAAQCGVRANESGQIDIIELDRAMTERRFNTDKRLQIKAGLRRLDLLGSYRTA